MDPTAAKTVAIPPPPPAGIPRLDERSLNYTNHEGENNRGGRDGKGTAPEGGTGTGKRIGMGTP